MCHAIVRIKYLSKEIEDLPIENETELPNKIQQLSTNELVDSFRVFTMAQEYKRFNEMRRIDNVE